MNESPLQFRPSEQEAALLRRFETDYSNLKNEFLSYRKDRFDHFYKLYRAYGGDRAAKIKDWQSNVFIPYIFSVIETLMPRILGSRPEFMIAPRGQEDVAKAAVLQSVFDYLWEVTKMDGKIPMFVKQSIIYGTSIGKTRWEKKYTYSSIVTEIEEQDGKKIPKYKEKPKLIYDNPQFDEVDIYDFYPDKLASDINKGTSPARYVFQRYVMTKDQLQSQYKAAKNLEFVKSGRGGNGSSLDFTDYKLVRREVLANKNRLYTTSGGGDKYDTNSGNLIEVVEYWERNRYVVRANGVPIINMPNPYSHGMIPFTKLPFVEMPGEFYGIGIAELLENMQVMLNTIKNQRIDNVTMLIHKMWIVDPLANINKADLVVKPFGIIYTQNPNGVRPVEFSDVKASSYTEEEKLKDDMRNATGVDDYSRGAGAMANSATEASYLREATLERIKLFLRNLETCFADVMQQWYALVVDFFPEQKVFRLVNKDGVYYFPTIKKEDYTGEFDFRVGANSTVASSIELKKKQDMDLFQLLFQLPFVDQRNLVVKILGDFGWDPDFILKTSEAMSAEGGPAGPGGAPGGVEAMMAAMASGMPPEAGAPKTLQGNTVTPDLGNPNTAATAYAERGARTLANEANQANSLQ